MWQIVAIAWSQDRDIGVSLGDYQLVKYQNLAAIIIRFKHESIDQLTPFEKIDALFSYQSILDTAGINRTILPIRFGTMVKQKKDVFRLLEKNTGHIMSLLQFAEDKAEFDLMGIWKGKIENFYTNIFEDLENKGYEVKKHQPANRAICFHLSILMSPYEQETFAIVKQDLDRKYGDKIDVRMSEPLPPYSFLTLDLNENAGQKPREPNLVAIRK